MGVVYLARDTRLGRAVALKAVSRGGTDAIGRARLQREARAAASLAHPGIATVYALEEDGDDCYLITEYLQGRTLRDELVDGPLPYGRWRLVAIAIAEAVGAAHAQGLVHRDLKPENVMRTEAGAIKVLDFGLARETTPLATGMTPTITQAGALVGTPGYMAPEQIRGQPLDARTDVFAVGVLLYELATGVHPFGAGMNSGGAADAAGMVAAGDVLARIVAEDPPPLETRLMLPPAAVAVVARALAKSPEARFADGRELAEALRALLAPALTPLPFGAPPSGAPSIPGSHDLRVQKQWWVVHQASIAAFYPGAGAGVDAVARHRAEVAATGLAPDSLVLGGGRGQRPPPPVVRGPLPGGRARARAAGGAALAAGDEPLVRGRAGGLGLRPARHARRHGLGVLRPGGGPCRGLGHGGAGDEPGVHGAAR